MSDRRPPRDAPIPAFDLGRAARRIEADVAEAWGGLLRDTSFVGGPAVAAFEAAFADYLGAAGCVGVANGTDALELALRALGVREGDEVVVPAFSFIATATAVVLAGARPVFADVEAETLNLDPDDAARRLGERTVGVIGVHLYGRPYDVERVDALARAHDLWTVEDAAQAHGAAIGDRRVGTFSPLATWSFYPSKNLGCFGDGGAVTGGDGALVERVRLLANHGRTSHYQHAEVGRNSRLDALQAAVLTRRLELLEADNARRREIACRYHGALDGIGDLRLLADRPGTTAVYHLFAVQTARRDALQEALAARGIGSGIHYPLPLHRQPALAHLAPGLELPVAEAAAREVLCLPIFPELQDAEVDRVCDAVREFFAG